MARMIGDSLSGFDYLWLVFCALVMFIILFFVCPCCICNQKYCRKNKFKSSSEECYKEILEQRGYNADKPYKGQKLWQLILRKDLRRKVIWTDNYKLDFSFLVRNEHPLLSTCCAHSMHPYSRSNRCLILIAIIICDIAATLVVSYLLTFTNIGSSSNTSSELAVNYTASFFIGFLLYIIQTLIVNCSTCTCCDRCCETCRYCGYCIAKATLITFFLTAILSLSFSIYFFISIKQIYGAATFEFWRVFLLQYIIGVFQAWFIIDIVHLYIYFSRKWRKAHTIEKDEKIDDDHSCCYNLLCVCFNCIKWIFCGCIICFWKCMTFIFCPRYKNDGTDEHGINYHEYIQWINKDKISKRDIPFRTLKKQYSHYVYDEDNQQNIDKDIYDTFDHQRFRSCYIEKDLEVAIKNQIELAQTEQNKNNNEQTESESNMKTERNQHDNDVLSESESERDDAE